MRGPTFGGRTDMGNGRMGAMGLFGKKDVSLGERLALAVFRHSPDAMLLLSDGKFIAGNAAVEQIYHRRLSEVLGHNPLDFSAPVRRMAARPRCISVSGWARRYGMASPGSNG